MAIYRPIKKIAIPIAALLIGLIIAFTMMPTKMDAIWNEWTGQTTKWEHNSYRITSAYMKDGVEASKETGIWSDELSHFKLMSQVSDDSTFTFDVYFEGEHLFIYSGEEWVQGTTGDRFVNEIAPLDHPFKWMRDMLAEADIVEKQKTKNGVTYVAVFEQFDEIDFRGYSLEKQEHTTLSLTVAGDNLLMEFNVIPIRPDHIGPFRGYPREMSYTIRFEKTDKKAVPLPEEAYLSKSLDE
ncbi:hypothetical protein GN156_03255 [bacterium LRH843]|nr:hypothetical protein [bacterium LRH843]